MLSFSFCMLLLVVPLQKILTQASSSRAHLVKKVITATTATAFHNTHNTIPRRSARTASNNDSFFGATRFINTRKAPHASIHHSHKYKHQHLNMISPQKSTFSTSSLSSSSSANNNNKEKDMNSPKLLAPPEKIIIVGSSNQDLTSYSNVVPKLGQTVMGERFEVSAGGKGANQAIAAAKMLLHPKQKQDLEKGDTCNNDHAKNVHIITRVGDDAFSKLLLHNFDESHVKYNQETIICKDSHTGVAPIIVDQKTGDNMIVVIPGANKLLTPEMVREEMSSLKDQINDFNRAIILSQLEVPIESTFEAMKIGKEWGALTILNPAPCNISIMNNDLLKYVDILIPNETELQQLFDSVDKKTDDSSSTNNNDNCDDNAMTEEDMAKTLLRNGIIQKAIIVTLGARGAMIVSRNNGGDDYETKMVNASPYLGFNNQAVVDTVGAGDSFCGSLSMYLSCGIELEEAATKACGVASMSVRKQGAQTSYPSAVDLPQELRLDGFRDEKYSSLSPSSSPSSSLSTRKTLTFVTGNKKKLEEVQQILSSGEEKLPFDITNQKIDLPELQGDPIDIAKEKCALAAKEINGPVFTEDTSLCFNALNSLPGPYIKWFLEKCGHDGLNSMLTGFEDKSAYAQTIVAFTWGPGEEIFIFDGRTHGSIVKPRGPLDFGWDPIFEPDESNGLTYAEMTKEDKNVISHRGKSFTKFQAFLASFGGASTKE